MKRFAVVIFVLIFVFISTTSCVVDPYYDYEIDFRITGSGGINRADITFGAVAGYYEYYGNVVSYGNVNISSPVIYDFWAETGDYLYLYAKNTSGSNAGELQIEIYVDGYPVSSSETSSIDGEVYIYYYLD